MRIPSRMNRFSAATRLNATKSEEHSQWTYKEALMNVLKGANITRPSESQIEVSPLENSIFNSQNFQRFVFTSVFFCHFPSICLEGLISVPSNMPNKFTFKDFWFALNCNEKKLYFVCLKTNESFLKKLLSGRCAPWNMMSFRFSKRLLQRRRVLPAELCYWKTPKLNNSEVTFCPTFENFAAKCKNARQFDYSSLLFSNFLARMFELAIVLPWESERVIIIILKPSVIFATLATDLIWFEEILCLFIDPSETTGRCIWDIHGTFDWHHVVQKLQNGSIKRHQISSNQIHGCVNPSARN